MNAVAPAPSPRRAAQARPSSITLENLLTHPAAFGLTTATPLQRAICRIADGLPLGELAGHPDVLAAVGDVSMLPSCMPSELLLVAAIRSGKSLLSSAIAVRSAITCDVSRLRAGEIPRVSVLSLTKDLADVVLNHLIGSLISQPALRRLVVGQPKADSILVRHPSGRAVEIKVVAGSRAGGSLVARWSAGVIFDEAPRMNGEGDAVINFDDARKAVIGRLLPGAQVVAVGSPWAPRGPIYERVMEFWGKPSRHLVVIRATGPQMNPILWTAQAIAELRAKDEQAYRTDVLGEFADPESAFFSTEDLKRATRTVPDVLPREKGCEYIATMDPATRGNAWTLVVAAKRYADDGQTRLAVARCRQWQGSQLEPLKPEVILEQIRDECGAYGLAEVVTDQWSSDAIAALARALRFNVVEHPLTGGDKVRAYESLRTGVLNGTIELSPDTHLRADLLSIRKRVTAQAISIELPLTSNGRHADYAPALVLAVVAAGESSSMVHAMDRLRQEGGRIMR